MRRTLLPILLASGLAVSGCESGGETAEPATPATPDPAAPAAPGTIEEQLAGMTPVEQRAYIAALTVRDGCLLHRENLDAAVASRVAAGFEEGSITNVPSMKAASLGSLRIYSNTDPSAGDRNLCGVDLPVEDFDLFASMLDAMIQQNFPGAERGKSGENLAWKLPGAPETFVVADATIEGSSPENVRMGALTFVAR